MCSLRQPECVCSSVDRAMPSGGMCGGSTPLRRFRHIPGGCCLQYPPGIFAKKNKSKEKAAVRRLHIRRICENCRNEKIFCRKVFCLQKMIDRIFRDIYDKRNKCAYRKREGIKWIPEEKANIQNQVI